MAPKRERLRVAETTVRQLLALLHDKRQQLRVLEERFAHLQQRFAVACAEKEKLELEQLDCSLKLARAERLMSKARLAAVPTPRKPAGPVGAMKYTFF